MSKKESRFTVTMGDDHRSRLAALAKKYRISQGEVIEVMLDSGVDLGPAMQAKRLEKVNGRTSIRSAIERERLKRQEEKEQSK